MAIIHLNKDTFEELVLKSEKKVLLDFWATWCGPCQMIAPVLEEIAADREDVLIGKIDVDKEMALAMEFGISSIPTLVMMEGGQVKNKLIGFHAKAAVEKLIDNG